MKGDELRKAVSHLAAAVLLARYWPSQGSRHEASLALLGLLLRAGWSQEDAVMWVSIVAKAAGDEEWRARANNVRTTAERLANERPATGRNRLSELMGIEVVKRVSQWLDITPTDGKDIQVRELHHTTDLGNAKRLVARHGEDIHYCHPWRKWLIWDETRWCVDETGEIERKAKETVRAIYEEAAIETNDDRRAKLAKWAATSESENRIRSMIALTKTESGIPVLPKQLDAAPWILNCLNGSIDLRTGKIFPARRDTFCTKLAPVAYDPEAECPRWLVFLSEIMEHKQSLINFLQLAFGYALTGDNSEQVLFILYGTGANGKTTLTETVKSALGGYASQADFGTFLLRKTDGIRNDLARLAGTRFVSASETEAGRHLSEALIKSITGGEPVPARFLYGEYFEFKAQFKLFLATNHKPIIRGTDVAIWRRIRLIPFKVTIPQEKQDRKLPEKLRAELPGILAWAVRGCLSWQADSLGAPEDVLTATQSYREEMDLLRSFLEECCVQNQIAKVPSGKLYKRYREWCDDNGEIPLTQQKFGISLSEHGFDRGKTGSVRVWKGVGLRNTGDCHDAVFP